MTPDTAACSWCGAKPGSPCTTSGGDAMPNRYDERQFHPARTGTTHDTAALRALADAATPGPWVYDVEHFEDINGADDFYHVITGDALVASELSDPDAAYIAALDPDTVRALCDAADEVERLRGERPSWVDAAMAQGYPVVCAQRDASRTAHAALVADLRALLDDDVHGLADLRAVLDRHAPEEGS